MSHEEKKIKLTVLKFLLRLPVVVEQALIYVKYAEDLFFFGKVSQIIEVYNLKNEKKNTLE